MSIKCRSCGFINPDNKQICDNCGCNLKYSKVFEKILENEKDSNDFLFEIGEKKEINSEDSNFLFDSSEEESIETKFQKDEDEYKPISFPDQTLEKREKMTKEIENREKNIRSIGKIISVELLEFFVFFFIILFLVKVLFANYSIPNGEISKSAIITYLFFNIQSYLLTGNRLSHHLIKKNGE